MVAVAMGEQHRLQITVRSYSGFAQGSLQGSPFGGMSAVDQKTAALCVVEQPDIGGDNPCRQSERRRLSFHVVYRFQPKKEVAQTLG